MSILDDILREPARPNQVSILNSQTQIALPFMKRIFENSTENTATAFVPVNVLVSNKADEERDTAIKNDPLLNSNEDEEIIEHQHRTNSAQQQQPRPDQQQTEEVKSEGEDTAQQKDSFPVVDRQQLQQKSMVIQLVWYSKWKVSTRQNQFTLRR